MNSIVARNWDLFITVRWWQVSICLSPTSFKRNASLASVCLNRGVRQVLIRLNDCGKKLIINLWYFFLIIRWGEYHDQHIQLCIVSVCQTANMRAFLSYQTKLEKITIFNWYVKKALWQLLEWTAIDCIKVLEFLMDWSHWI